MCINIYIYINIVYKGCLRTAWIGPLCPVRGSQIPSLSFQDCDGTVTGPVAPEGAACPAVWGVLLPSGLAGETAVVTCKQRKFESLCREETMNRPRLARIRQCFP